MSVVDGQQRSGANVSNYCNICNKEKFNHATKKHPDGVCVSIEIANAVLSAERHSVLYSDDPGARLQPRQQLKVMRFAKSGRNFREAIRDSAKLIAAWKSGNAIPIACYSYLATFHERVLQFLAGHHGLRSEYDVSNGTIRADKSTQENARIANEGVMWECPTEHVENPFVCNSENEDNVELEDCVESETEFATFNLSIEGEGEAVENASNPNEVTPCSLLAGVNVSNERERTTYGEFLRLMKRKLRLSNRQMDKYMDLFQEMQPVFDENESLPKTGRGLAGKAQSFARKFKIRKVDDGFGHENYPELHPAPVSTTARTLAQAITRRALGGQRKNKNDTNSRKNQNDENVVRKGMGDVADFGIQNGIFLDGPGNVHTWEHRCMLRRLNAANSKLLSPALLKVADPSVYEEEAGNGLLSERPAQNYISIKVFVDGVQICDNGQVPQAIPIAATIDTVAPYDPETKMVDWSNAQRVPFRHAKPFFISVYHGLKKPDLFQFFQPFFSELIFLDPERELEEYEYRKCVVQLRCMICDSPMVSLLTGTKSPGAKTPCQRCTVVGKTIPQWKARPGTRVPTRICVAGENQGIYYATLKYHTRRRIESWLQYPEHAYFDTPFYRHGIDLVRHFIIDAMHTIDGGVLRVAIQLLFSVGFPGKRWKYIPEGHHNAAFHERVNEYLAEWRRNVSRDDYARKPRHLKDVARWKMRETHTAGVLLVPALYAVTNLTFDADFFNAYMCLITGMRLVYRFSHKPIPKVDVDDARHMFKTYLNFFLVRDRFHVFTFLAHKLTHICDDVELYECGLGYNSAYPFENDMALLPKFMMPSTRPMTTLVRNLAEEYYLDNEKKPIRAEMERFEKELELCAKLKRIDIPATTMKDFVETAYSKKLICEGFTLTNKFPNNFVLFKSNTTQYKADVVCVVDFSFDDDSRTNGDVIIIGHKFKSMEPSWDFGSGGLNYSRFHSYVVGEIDENRSNWKGSTMIGKGTPLHLKLVGDSEEKLEGTEGEQEWVVHLLDHCLP